MVSTTVAPPVTQKPRGKKTENPSLASPARDGLIVCDTSLLKRAVALARQFTLTKTALPILSNLLLDARNGRLTVTGYDMGVGGQIEMDVKFQGEATTTVRASLLAEIIDALDSPITTLWIESSKLRVVSASSEFVIDAMPADDFPMLPVFGGEVSFKLKSSLLREVIRQVAFAVSREIDRGALMGVLFEVSEGRLTAVATDCHQAAIKVVNLDDSTGAGSGIIPVKMLDGFCRSIGDDAESDVEFHLSRIRAFLRCRDVTIVSRLIEGPFANYEHVIPKSPVVTWTVNRDGLWRSVRRAAIVARDGIANRIEMIAKDGDLKILARRNGVGNTLEQLPIDGGDFGLCLNSSYLLDMLSVLTSKDVSIEIEHSLHPLLISGVGDSSIRFIAAPLKPAS